MKQLQPPLFRFPQAFWECGERIGNAMFFQHPDSGHPQCLNSSKDNYNMKNMKPMCSNSNFGKESACSAGDSGSIPGLGSILIWRIP